MPRLVLVTGLQAAGKSTVGGLLATKLGPPAVHFDGDVLFRMVVAGHATMTADPQPEAERQLALRYQAAALLAQHYLDNGFDFVYSDIMLGEYVAEWLAGIRRARRHLVVLTPPVEVVAARERDRGTQSYQGWHSAGESLEDAIRRLGSGLAETTRKGLWLDNSGQSPAQTVARILTDDLRAARFD